MAAPRITKAPLRLPDMPDLNKAGFKLTQKPTIPSVPKPPTFGKAPKAIQVILQTEIWKEPNKPDWLIATKPEWLCYWALTKLGYVPDVDFTFQSSQMGIRYEAGAAVADFLITNRTPNLVIRIQGNYWHYQMGSERIGIDVIQRQELATRGLDVVDIDEKDIEKDPIYYTNLALADIDVSMGSRMRLD